MKKPVFILWIGVFVGLMVIPIGCGQKQSDHSEEKKTEGGGHGEESPSGATFNPGKGVILTNETRQILGLEVVDVKEEMLPQVIELNIQIFGETHRAQNLDKDHAGCDVHGSGYLPQEEAALVQPKQTVKLVNSRNQTLDGFVVAVQKQSAHGETEVIVGVTTEASELKEGEFANATISIPRNEAVTVIPSSALLRTVAGTFVYVVNGEAYFRSAVKLGSQTTEKIEVVDGLYSGDQVVTKPVETLWIIELRATKGGGHSH